MSVLIDGMILITGLGGFSALLLVTLARRFKEDSSEVVNLVNRVLPQTQCAQCGYPGCRPYAEAIVKGEAINRCPPGGDSTISVLAELLGRKIETLDERCGEHKPPQVAVIREEECIGCTLCITACPVDAIIGATRQMHTVIESECTGCDLCLEPCPVDCIDMQPLPQKNPAPVQIAEAPTPCINCGRCIDVCPRDLQPQQLYWHRNSTDTLDRYRLDDCIECGLCDNACPSDIPLTSIFRHSKTARTIRDQSIKIAARTEQRFILREARMADARNRIIERPSENDRSALLASIKAAAGRDKS